jgi:hypothetical protein
MKTFLLLLMFCSTTGLTQGLGKSSLLAPQLGTHYSNPPSQNIIVNDKDFLLKMPNKTIQRPVSVPDPIICLLDPNCMPTFSFIGIEQPVANTSSVYSFKNVNSDSIPTIDLKKK